MLILVASLMVAAGSVTAQELGGDTLGDLDSLREADSSWSPVADLFWDDSGEVVSRPVTAAADVAGTVHAIFRVIPNRDDRQNAYLAYARLEEGRWTLPIDVAVSNLGIEDPRLVADDEGWLHLSWSAGSLRYVRVPLHQADQVLVWTQDQDLGPPTVSQDLALLPDGRIALAYSTGNELRLLLSTGSGVWEESRPVIDLRYGLTQAGDLGLEVDGHGRLHLIWTEYLRPESWPPAGQYYSRSLDGGQTWEDPRRFGDGASGQISASFSAQDCRDRADYMLRNGLCQGQGGLLAHEDNELHVVWRGISVSGGSFHVYSLDGGQHWSQINSFDPDGGFSGRQTMAMDSAGKLHLVRADGGYHTWDGTSWTPVVFADSGETGTLAIALGDQLHWFNSARSTNATAYVVHRLRELGVPGFEPREILDQPVLDVAMDAASSLVPEPSPSPDLNTVVAPEAGQTVVVPAETVEMVGIRTERGSLLPLLAALIPTLGLLVFVVAKRR